MGAMTGQHEAVLEAIESLSNLLGCYEPPPPGASAQDVLIAERTLTAIAEACTAATVQAELLRDVTDVRCDRDAVARCVNFTVAVVRESLGILAADLDSRAA